MGALFSKLNSFFLLQCEAEVVLDTHKALFQS